MKTQLWKFLMIHLPIGLLTVFTANAQCTLTGELRPRFEYRHGYQTLADTGQDAATFISQRSRLNFGYKAEKFKVGVSIQDVRVWGDQPQLNISDNLLSIHEAWGEWMFGKNASLKVGRQELVYDDQRIFGNYDWSQQGRSHDVALLKFGDSTMAAHIGYAYNQDMEQMSTNVYTVPNNYKTMQFLWLHKEYENIKVSVLFVNNGLQYTSGVNSSTKYSVKYTQTMGARIVYKYQKLKANAAYYSQIGEDAANKNVTAFDAAAFVKYQFVKSFHAGVGYEMLSGTSQTDVNNKDNNSFNPLYGTSHSFNGYMDYFYSGNYLNTVGLQDFYLKLKYKPGKTFIGIDGHAFMSAANILDKQNVAENKAMNSYLGMEGDATIGYKVNDFVKITAGYSQFFATSSLVAVKGGSKNEDSNWAYLMLTFKPHFLEK